MPSDSLLEPLWIHHHLKFWREVLNIGAIQWLLITLLLVKDYAYACVYNVIDFWTWLYSNDHLSSSDLLMDRYQLFPKTLIAFKH